MKASIYFMVNGLYLAILDNGQKIMRNSLRDLARTLRTRNVSAEDLLFGDWCADAELLTQWDRQVMKQLMNADDVL